MPGMIEEHLKLYNDGKPLHPDSFFVGDAAGRPRDHSGPLALSSNLESEKLTGKETIADSDRKMALSVPMTFFTPEEFFLQAPTQTYTLSRFDMMSLSDPGALTVDSTEVESAV